MNLWVNKAALDVLVLFIGLTIVTLDYDFILLPQRVFDALTRNFAFLFRPYSRANITLFLGVVVGSTGSTQSAIGIEYLVIGSFISICSLLIIYRTSEGRKGM